MTKNLRRANESDLIRHLTMNIHVFKSIVLKGIQYENLPKKLSAWDIYYSPKTYELFLRLSNGPDRNPQIVISTGEYLK